MTSNPLLARQTQSRTLPAPSSTLARPAVIEMASLPGAQSGEAKASEEKAPPAEAADSEPLCSFTLPVLLGLYVVICGIFFLHDLILRAIYAAGNLGWTIGYGAGAAVFFSCVASCIPRKLFEDKSADGLIVLAAVGFPTVVTCFTCEQARSSFALPSSHRSRST